MTRTILQPMQAMTVAAQGISEGNLDQVVPYQGADELGQLAQAFNTMARHLRDYRQSQSAQLLRAQQTIQATIDSFPDPVLVIEFEGAVEMANPAARQLLGVVPRQKNHPGTGIWQPPDALAEPLAEALQGQRDFLPEGFDKVILLGSGGRERAVSPRILTIRDPYGNALGAAVVLQDVTRLRLLDQVKSNLVATASHELKTPLYERSARRAPAPRRIWSDFSIPNRLSCCSTPANSERLLARPIICSTWPVGAGSRQRKSVPNPPTAGRRRRLKCGREPSTRESSCRAGSAGRAGGVAVDVPRLGHAQICSIPLTYTDRGGRITLAAATDAGHVPAADRRYRNRHFGRAFAARL